MYVILCSYVEDIIVEYTVLFYYFISRPSYPVIVEEDENLNNSSTEETDRIKDKDGSPQGKPSVFMK